MPARSESQRRYLNAKFGHEWTKRHGFDNKGKLPSKSNRKSGRKRMIAEFQRKHGGKRGRSKR